MAICPILVCSHPCADDSCWSQSANLFCSKTKALGSFLGRGVWEVTKALPYALNSGASISTVAAFMIRDLGGAHEACKIGARNPSAEFMEIGSISTISFGGFITLVELIGHFLPGYCGFCIQLAKVALVGASSGAAYSRMAWKKAGNNDCNALPIWGAFAAVAVLVIKVKKQQKKHDRIPFNRRKYSLDPGEEDTEETRELIRANLAIRQQVLFPTETDWCCNCWTNCIKQITDCITLWIPDWVVTVGDVLIDCGVTANAAMMTGFTVRLIKDYAQPPLDMGQLHWALGGVSVELLAQTLTWVSFYAKPNSQLGSFCGNATFITSILSESFCDGAWAYRAYATAMLLKSDKLLPYFNLVEFRAALFAFSLVLGLWGALHKINLAAERKKERSANGNGNRDVDLLEIDAWTDTESGGSLSPAHNSRTSSNEGSPEKGSPTRKGSPTNSENAPTQKNSPPEIDALIGGGFLTTANSLSEPLLTPRQPPHHIQVSFS